MAAAEKTETEVVFHGDVGGGLAFGKYTVTIANTLDWVILSKFSSVLFAKAWTNADGVDGEAFIDTTTANKVVFTQTGAQTLWVVGLAAKSTGG